MAVNKVIYGGETLVDLTGDSVTPETLAEGATAHDASGQKITGKMAPGGGSSVQTDWDQNDSYAADFLKNKPFYYSPTGGDTLTWDGNTEGLLSVMDVVYKVSSVTPTMTDFANGCTFTMNGESHALSFEEIQQSVPIDGVFAIGAIFVVNPEGVGADLDGLAFPEAGIYFMYIPGDMMATSIAIPGYTGFPVTVEIEEKFIPTSVKADKGPIVLYMDEEKYLYAEVGTNLNADYDTSDTTKRITQNDLKGFLASGRAIYFLYGEYKNTYLPAWIKWRGEYGTAGSNIVVNNVAVDIVAYTSEYTS